MRFPFLPPISFEIHLCASSSFILKCLSSWVHLCGKFCCNRILHYCSVWSEYCPVIIFLVKCLFFTPRCTQNAVCFSCLQHPGQNVILLCPWCHLSFLSPAQSCYMGSVPCTWCCMFSSSTCSSLFLSWVKHTDW